MTDQGSITPSPDESRFLESYDASRFARPSLTVDVVLITTDLNGQLQSLLIRRDQHPHKGAWSLPGGFMGINESLDQAAERVLKEKAGLSGIYVEQLYTFGDINRDPRTRVVSVVYYALVDFATLKASLSNGDSSTMLSPVSVDWIGERGGAASAFDPDGSELSLAFDHHEMIGLTIKRLRGKLNYAPIGFELLPPTFTLRQLQDVHEIILGHELNKDAFRRRMLATDLLEATGEREQAVGHRPAELYRWIEHNTNR